MNDHERAFLLAHPELFLSHYFRERLDGDLKQFHMEVIDAATKEEKALLLEPAGHGKTTLTSTLLPIHAICKWPNIRIALIAKNDEEKEGIANVIQAELQDNDDLIRDFGPFRPEGTKDASRPWSLSRMTVQKRTIRAKEPTLALFGQGAKNVLGHRTNWTICDDVVTNENSATPQLREKMRGWFNLSVATTMLPGGRLTVIGTRFDPEDLYGDLIELMDPETGEPMYSTILHDAIVDEEQHLTLWPEYWPWRRLMAKKAEIGTLDFNKRYRNIAVDKSRLVFKEEYVKGGEYQGVKYPGCLDRDYTIGDYDETWLRLGGFDAAIGTSRKAKFCAHVTLAVGSCPEHQAEGVEKCLWVVDLKRDQMSTPTQRDLIIEQHQHYKMFKTNVEANAYQAGLVQVIDEAMKAQGIALRIDPHLTGANKIDPEIGVSAMVRWFENGWVHIPWKDVHSQRIMRQLVEELIMYPKGRTTDTVMAFWFAWLIAQEGVGRFRSYSRLDTTPNTWGKRPRLGQRIVRNPIYVRD